jgi:hypothetical protein
MPAVRLSAKTCFTHPHVSSIIWANSRDCQASPTRDTPAHALHQLVGGTEDRESVTTGSDKLRKGQTFPGSPARAPGSATFFHQSPRQVTLGLPRSVRGCPVTCLARPKPKRRSGQAHTSKTLSVNYRVFTADGEDSYTRYESGGDQIASLGKTDYHEASGRPTAASSKGNTPWPHPESSSKPRSAAGFQRQSFPAAGPQSGHGTRRLSRARP